ncbi:MAG: DNA-processing protein DprA [Bacteroidia bacterium]
MDKELKYKIGITLIPGVGHVIAKTLISYCGSAEAVFKEKAGNLLKIPDIGSITTDAIINQDVLERAEKEVEFIEENDITPLFYLDKAYPLRLKQCNDGPVMLYYQGNADLNTERIVAIVGTRSATQYGKKLCEELVNGLQPTGALIVSGLAFGIDVCSHKAAIDAGLPTLGVVAHGLDKLYPPEHYNLSRKMIENGGILTDFISGTDAARENFPKRNRIIAGLADAVIVVESKISGGAMITADIAFSYSREVMAFPGRVDDAASQGCNKLIQQNKAYLVRNADDVTEYLGWKKDKKDSKQQKELLFDLSPEQESIINTLKSSESPMHIDDIAINSKLAPGLLSSHLLTLEFAGVLKSLPGKMYSL